MSPVPPGPPTRGPRATHPVGPPQPRPDNTISARRSFFIHRIVTRYVARPMRLSRRDLLSATAGGVVIASVADARGLLIESQLSDVSNAALDAAKKAGAS